MKKKEEKWKVDNILVSFNESCIPKLSFSARKCISKSALLS